MAKYRLIFADGSTETVDVYGPFTAWVAGKSKARAKKTYLLNIERIESSSAQAEKRYFVRYIDLATGKEQEKTLLERELYDLYMDQRAGKISIIEIHKVGSPVEIEGSPVRIRHVEVDAELDRMLEAKKGEWRRKGYPEHLISMAVDLANEWAGAISGAFAPPELRTDIIRHIYPKALEVADHWITKFGEAARGQAFKSFLPDDKENPKS